MDFLAPTDILIIIASLALLAVLLDIARRLKKSRYENLQMSSRHLKKTASDLDNFEEDDFENIPRRYEPIGAVLRSCIEDVSGQLR